MSDGRRYNLAQMALLFTAAAGLAIGAKLIMDESRNSRKQIAPPNHPDAPQQTAKIIEFKPRP